jgi:hypothetical protein
MSEYILLYCYFTVASEFRLQSITFIMSHLKGMWVNLLTGANERG